LRIYNNSELLEDIIYEEKLNEYYINEIGTPTTLKLDARFIRADNLLYTLKEINWDFNSDGDTDETKKLVEYDLSTPGNHTISVEYTFVHRKIPDDIIKVKETIFVEGMKKDAILDLQIDASSEYTPSIVRFDASKSIIKNEDIAKFVWDFGNGIIYE
jgi:PKD repeat protein